MAQDATITAEAARYSDATLAHEFLAGADTARTLYAGMTHLELFEEGGRVYHDYFKACRDSDRNASEKNRAFLHGLHSGITVAMRAISGKRA